MISDNYAITKGARNACLATKRTGLTVSSELATRNLGAIGEPKVSKWCDVPVGWFNTLMHRVILIQGCGGILPLPRPPSERFVPSYCI
jgi:hypothetical protein